MTRPSYQTVRILFARSGNQCAFPNCPTPISDLTANTITGEIAHIKADSPGGPRYDPDQSENERQGLDNLMVLCPQHHKIIDLDPTTYSVDILMRMKAAHESKQHQMTIMVLTPSALDELSLVARQG